MSYTNTRVPIFMYCLWLIIIVVYLLLMSLVLCMTLLLCVMCVQFSIRKHQTDATLVVRVSSSVAGVTAAQAFSKLLNYSNRTAWDFMCKCVGVCHVHLPVLLNGNMAV